MILYNLTICSYCFNVSDFAKATFVCMILHSRKFPTSHRYILMLAYLCYFISFHLNSFSFLKFILVFALGFRDLTIDQLLPSRFYPIVNKTFSTCTGFSSCSSACYKVSTNYTLDFEYF